eukprot:6214043-Pleurochrysis_carterae.AAC.2
MEEACGARSHLEVASVTVAEASRAGGNECTRVRSDVGGDERWLGRMFGVSAISIRTWNVRSANIIACGRGPLCRDGRSACAIPPATGLHQDSVGPVGGEQGRWVDATGHAESARVKDPKQVSFGEGPHCGQEMSVDDSHTHSRFKRVRGQCKRRGVSFRFAGEDTLRA